MPREPDEREPDEEPTWQEIAEQVTHEQDPAKIIELTTKLNEALLAEEREKAKRRVSITPDPKPGAA
jgi:hypothetical protein